MFRYDLDEEKVITGDPIETINNMFDLLSCIVGTMILPDEESEEGFLAGPMAKFYVKKEDIEFEETS